VYKCLYTSGGEQRIIVDESSPDTKVSLCLKDLYLWGDSGPRLYACEDINEAMMEKASFSGSRFIKGRALVEKAKITMRNVKKAMSMLTSKLNKNGGGLASGHSMEDLYKEVLDEMWLLLKGNDIVSLEASDCEEVVVSAEKQKSKATEKKNSKEGEKCVRPSDWTFPGWFVLISFGPTAPKEQQLNLFTLGDPPETGDKKQYGRSAQRKETAKQSERDRKVGSGTDRGMSASEKIAMANIMVMKKAEDREKIDSRVFGYTTQQQMVEKKLARAMERAKITNDFTVVDELEAKQEDFSKKIQDLLASPQAGQNNQRGSKRDDPIDSLIASIGSGGFGGVTPSSPMETPVAKKKKTTATLDLSSSGGETPEQNDGFNGAVGSCDATHVGREKSSTRLSQAHSGHKLKLPSRTYNID
jgi:hypothetical protein